MSPSPAAKKAADAARKAAEAAAQKALQEKVALVGAIGEAQAAVQDIDDEKAVLHQKYADDVAVLDDKIADAERGVRTAYDGAVAGGWSAKDLTEMGLSAPKKKRNARQRKVTDPAPAAAAAETSPVLATRS